ncbi:hypothetical protein [Candidatus Phytoplasma meliae]|uniref:Uncharacterized protein n=1 Tax=Candidatus Phytoplasma meliae TaxID=1848402 RepID=A0ABS5CYZ1_9MOLU|nr:hypothetical protein [Candidatus Phytoplasma meliae]MBP5835791.1 hypothetical protein [Candidatus Phytoplasma meliae]MBP5836198.1 hypothetical protein [Candidatus Phytoplasma meliae]
MEKKDKPQTLAEKKYYDKLVRECKKYCHEYLVWKCRKSGLITLKKTVNIKRKKNNY